jgi:threonine aldolase
MTSLHDTNYRGFASDNYAGAHPEVLAAIADANGGHQIAYGEDVYTARLQEVIKERRPSPSSTERDRMSPR